MSCVSPDHSGYTYGTTPKVIDLRGNPHLPLEEAEEWAHQLSLDTDVWLDHGKKIVTLEENIPRSMSLLDAHQQAFWIARTAEINQSKVIEIEPDSDFSLNLISTRKVRYRALIQDSSASQP